MKVVAHAGARIWGGAERAVVKLLSDLAARGHEVRLLCNSQVVLRGALNRGVPAELLRIGGDLALPGAFRLTNRLNDLRPDVFLVTTYKKLFLASLGAHLAKAPRVVVRVGLETDTPRSFKYRYALERWVDAVVVNSTAMAAPFARLPRVGSARVRVIHNGVEAPGASICPGRLRANLGIPPDAFVIGTAARLADQKRIDRLVEALSLLPADVHCIVAGDGERRASIDAEADARGVRPRFHLLGHRDDLQEVFDALDVYVVSSDREGLSNAMLEAMAFGLPIVSTRVSGAEDALGLRGGRQAGLITDLSAAALHLALLALRNDAAMRGTMGAEAAARASSDFSSDRALDQWEAVLFGPLPERV